MSSCEVVRKTYIDTDFTRVASPRSMGCSAARGHCWIIMFLIRFCARVCQFTRDSPLSLGVERWQRDQTGDFGTLIRFELQKAFISLGYCDTTSENHWIALRVLEGNPDAKLCSNSSDMKDIDSVFDLDSRWTDYLALLMLLLKRDGPREELSAKKIVSRLRLTRMGWCVFTAVPFTSARTYVDKLFLWLLWKVMKTGCCWKEKRSSKSVFQRSMRNQIE